MYIFSQRFQSVDFGNGTLVDLLSNKSVQIIRMLQPRDEATVCRGLDQK